MLSLVCGSLRWCPESGVSVRGKIGVLIAAEAGALVCREAGAPFPTSLEARVELLVTAANAEVRDHLLQASARLS